MHSRATGYVVCASPRTGSTLLCDLLAQTGVAGDPRSYFRPASVAEFAGEWALDVPDGTLDRSYVDAVHERGTAGTSRFGMRIMWSDLVPFVARLHELYPGHDGDAEVLRDALGVRAFVRLSRDDTIAQAVSLVLAEQTGLWHRHADGSERQRSHPAQPPRYDRDAIGAAVRLLEEEARGWSDWFDRCGITPLRVTYEQLVADTAGTLSRIVEHLGAAAPASVSIGTSKLADSVNDEWAARYRSEARSR